MRTAIFVYEPTLLNIHTYEAGLQICHAIHGSSTLAPGTNALQVLPGVYKIISNQGVDVSGDTLTFEFVVSPNDKTDFPEPTPKFLAGNLWAPDVPSLQAFFVVPDAKEALHV